ncbi:ERF family protein [Caulobacter hibisci]|uniref:ERF family protein n=1 Tax=Caulobacter hibisci TaxID=2035993 RepID=A0ABS0SRY5_9CAUL|nr:ERF family protein [Caulobacter hibisci]MBI1682339.1 ERF family protein [Caulobacter hibisci]
MTAQPDLLDVTPTAAGKPERALSAAPRQQSAQVIKTDSDTLMAVITKAAKDPDMDVDKLDKLITLYGRITANQAEQDFDEAMNAAQAEIGVVVTDKANSQTSSRYASYPALDRAVRPIYTRHGFSLSFSTGKAERPDDVRVICKVSHKGGHKSFPYVDMPADGKGAKGGEVMTRIHAAGSAYSYGQRYLLKLIFNIATGETDDDGNGASGGRALGAAAQRAVADINACANGAELKAWKDRHADAVEKLVTPAENREIIALWNRRARAEREKAAAHG